ncbi:MAG: PIG-L deacetylase family protein [Promethearchaeota archaeon]
MKKVIFFQAHPDDLEFYCFHLLNYLSQKSKKNYKVKIGSLTRGEYGWPKHAEHFKGERLGKLRTKELYKAMSFYGITPRDVHFFEIIDGYVEFNRKTIDLIKDYLNKEKPDIIFACEPRATYYRHPDHINTGKILYYILDKNLIDFGKKRPKLYFYASINPNFFWPINKEEIPLAYNNMFVHKSQAHIWKFAKSLYRLIISVYGCRIKGWRYAEGYRRIFYGAEKSKNKKLKFSGRLFLLLNVKIWPEKVTHH